MEELLKKARRLSILERKSLLEKGINLLHCEVSKQDEAIIEVLSMIYTEKELDSIKSAEDEDALLSKVLKETYQLDEGDSKN